MTGVILRRMYSLVVPGGVLLAAAVGLLRWAEPETVRALLRVYPYAVLAAGLLLGWRFKRLGVMFTLLALAAADRALVHLVATGGAEVSDVGRTVFHAAALLLPLNLAGFSLLSERGAVWERAATGLVVLGGQFVAVAGLAWLAPAGGAELWEHEFVTGLLAAWTPISQPALLAFLLALAVVAARCVISRRALDHSYLWATVAAWLALHRGGELLLRAGRAEAAAGVTPAEQATVFLSTAGLILVVGVMEASYAMAYRDELTRLPARRALDETLQQLSGDFAIAMVDIDHFKKFNDTYGHEAGDQVLQMVASKLGRVGGGGKAFRYGGEEFALVFPGRGQPEALPHLEAVRRAVEESRFTLRAPDRPRRRPKHLAEHRAGDAPASGYSRKQVRVTVSIGVAEPSPGASRPEEIIQAADRALYRAKRAGRNQVRA